MQKIGLLMGSFDPIHIGHINMAMCVINADLCDKVLFVVAMQNPWKEKKSRPFDDRCEMVSLSICNARMELCRIEEDIEPPNYSYKTLERIKEEYGEDNEYYIICGSDVLAEMENWAKYDERIKGRFKTISFYRFNTQREPFEHENFRVRETPNGYAIMQNPLEVSSTVIRDMLREGKDPQPLVTSEAYQYMIVNSLYFQ